MATRRFEGSLRRLSFKNRIQAVFICLLIFAVATTGGISYYIVSNVIEEQALKQSQDSLNKSAQVLDERLRKILVYMMTFTISQPFKELMADLSAQENRYYYKHLAALQTQFEQSTLNERSISSILISTSIGDFYSTTQRRVLERPFQDTALYNEMITSNPTQRVYWSDEHKDELFMDGKYVISLVFEPSPQKELKDIYMVVNVDARDIYDLIEGPNNEFDRNSFIKTSHNTSVFKHDNEYFHLVNYTDLSSRIGAKMTDSFIFPRDKEDYLINYAKLQVYPDWTLFTVQPKSDLLRLIEGIRWLTIIIVLVCTVLIVYITNILTGILFKPLMQLQYLMNRIGQNNLHLRFQSKYTDELSQMGEKFNQMLDEINLLMERNTMMERDKHVAEVKALQAQINPHFLYNSLNMIFLKCMDNQYDKAKEMVVSLSKLFELGLNKGLEGTTIEMELNHVEYYMKIQQACYRQLFEYEIHIQDTSLLAFPMLKIMLQPLVENSIMHGFKDRATNGKIDIHVFQQDNQIVLIVEDNGLGMDTNEVYAQIQDSQSDSYALRNVYNRLKLYGGDQAHLTLTSIPNVKTEVRLSIPINLMEGGPL
jgi:two-component system sensor histidine kinase YesM